MKIIRLGMHGMLLLAACLIPIAASAATPRLQVAPTIALFDQVVHIAATGLPRGDVVTFTLQRTGPSGIWRSSAACRADAAGRADLATCTPIRGSYSGADAMGLFWSLSPVDRTAAPARRAFADRSNYQLTARTVTKIVGSMSLQRIASDATVQEIALPAGLVGKAYAPTAPGKHPAMLLVGGSEGGHSMDVEAALLASHGYVALSLAYFGEAPLPAHLVNVPLETIKGGLDFLASRADVDPAHIGMMGVSKGGELTLLAASMFPQIKAVVGIVPSSVVWMGINPQDPATPVASWSYHGNPLDYVPGDPQAGMALGTQVASGKPLALEPYYAASLKNADAVAKSAIAVENIHGPVMLISGDSDRMWPSSPMSDAVMQRLQAMHHPYQDVHLHYKDAGHTSFFPYSATYGITAYRGAGVGFDFGGTEIGDAKAAEDAWPKMIRFLNAALANSGDRK